MPNVLITSFNNGEISPHIDTRSDVEKYASSCRILENMLPLVYGDVTRIPGTIHVGSAKTSDGCRLIPFVYSTSIAYICEFGEGYIRFSLTLPDEQVAEAAERIARFFDR